jgi:hypothetical protein
MRPTTSSLDSYLAMAPCLGQGLASFIYQAQLTSQQQQEWNTYGSGLNSGEEGFKSLYQDWFTGSFHLSSPNPISKALAAGDRAQIQRALFMMSEFINATGSKVTTYSLTKDGQFSKTDTSIVWAKPWLVLGNLYLRLQNNTVVETIQNAPLNLTPLIVPLMMPTATTLNPGLPLPSVLLNTLGPLGLLTSVSGAAQSVPYAIPGTNLTIEIRDAAAHFTKSEIDHILSLLGGYPADHLKSIKYIEALPPLPDQQTVSYYSAFVSVSHRPYVAGVASDGVFLFLLDASSRYSSSDASLQLESFWTLSGASTLSTVGVPSIATSFLFMAGLFANPATNKIRVYSDNGNAMSTLDLIWTQDAISFGSFKFLLNGAQVTGFQDRTGPILALTKVTIPQTLLNRFVVIIGHQLRQFAARCSRARRNHHGHGSLPWAFCGPHAGDRSNNGGRSPHLSAVHACCSMASSPQSFTHPRAS